MGRSKRDITLDDIAIAILRTRGLNAATIASQLGLNASEVSRSLTRTRDKLWKIGVAIEGPGMTRLSTEMRLRADDRAHGKSMREISSLQLQQLTQSELPHFCDVILIEARNKLLPDPDSHHWATWMDSFARQAVPRLRELFATGRVWGVTWGSHVAAVVDALTTETEGTRRRNRDVSVLPLCGNRFGDRRISESSSAIAERLGRAFAGRVVAPGALTMVPAFILGDLSLEQTVPMWMHIIRSPGYCEIFGVERIPKSIRPAAPAAQPWVKRLDGVLTSVSRDGFPFGYGENRMVENAGYRREAIDKHYLGDIGGVGLVRSGQKELQILEDRWTGVRRDELRACAARCAASGGALPGVVVVASGAERANSLLESLRCGYVNHIVIDQDLNDALVTRWQMEVQRPPKR